MSDLVNDASGIEPDSLTPDESVDPMQSRLSQLPQIARSFGIEEPKCPTCERELKKTPKRKVKCKSCSNPIYPRENPVTKQKVLISDEDLPVLDELHAYVNGHWEAWFKNYHEIEVIRGELARQWGLKDPSQVPVADAEWRRITMQANECLTNSDWCGYRSARDSGIRLLSQEHRYKDAVPLACEYIYLSYTVNRMERAYEALGLPEEMRTPLPPKMHGPQVVMIDFVEPDIERLRKAYMEEMQHAMFERVFDLTPEEAFKLYVRDRNEHHQALRDGGSFEDYLASIERARSKAK